MAAYISVGFTALDKELLQSYSARAAPTIAHYQGEFLAKAPVQTLNGEATYESQVIIAFPNKQLAESWYHSAEYQALIALRDKAMASTFVLLG